MLPGAPHEPLNITLLTTSFPRFSGDAAGRFIYECTEHLAGPGRHIRVLAPHGPGIAKTPLSEKYAVHHFRYFFPARWESLAYSGGMISRLKANRLRALLMPFFMVSFFFAALRQARRADLLHAYWTPAALVALAVKPFCQASVVVTLWGSDILFTRWRPFSGVLRWCLNRSDAIICESSLFKDELIAFGLPAEKISIIANGIDLNRFQPRGRASARKELGLSEEGFVFLSVGSCSPVKGHSYLIDAMPGILEKFSAARFILVGDGEERPSLEKAARDRGVADHITFAGWREPRAIPTWMNTADAFIHPSLREGNPNAVLEAMASGLPVICTEVGGVGEMIEEGENGLLIAAESASAIVEKALLLARDDKLRSALGRKARRFVETRYDSWSKQAERVAQLYETLPGVPPASAGATPVPRESNP